MAAEPFNPQTVKFVQDTRNRLQGYIDQQNMFVSVIANMKAQGIDGVNAPTQVDLDEVNRMGQQNWGGQAYVPITPETWAGLVSAMTAIHDGWTLGQNASFLNAKP
jgi:hypothetical protein